MTSAGPVLTAAAAVACGASAGVFTAFSTFVLPALDRLPAPAAAAAMQAVNRAAVTPPFMTLLFGSAGLCLGVGAVAAAGWDGEGARWATAGAAVFLVGVIGVTVVRNVPLNDALAAVVPDGPDAAGEWARYRRAWGGWNHVRTVAGVAATALLTGALLRG
ncbi:anthrone oxygenase family protein [Patulibacter sp. S7RM1-6]